MDILDVTITSRKWIIIFLLIFDWTKDLRDLCANNGLNSRFCGISSSIVDALLVDFAICKGDLAFMDERCPIDSQNSPPSVIFSFSRRNYVPNIPLKVTVSTENTGSHFRNFVLQARDYSTSLSVGSFNSTHTDDDVRLVVCNDTLKDTATAGETFRERSTFIVYWTPPPGFQKTVVFHVDAVTTGACGRASATSAEIIPHLEECFNIGESPYLGSVSHSKSGYECLRWNSPDVKNIFVGLDNTTYVSNFCRSQTSDSTPGCYVMSDRVTFEECDIPKCTSIASQFIEFGESVGDERLSRDQTPSVLNFTTKFPITNSRHKAAAIFEDGVVVLGSSSHSFEPFHLWPNGTFIYDRLEDCREKRTCKSRSVIAPFWTNIRRQQTQTGQGYVFYRQSTDHDLMLRLGDIINENRRFGEEHQQYKPSWALIVTWHLVSDNASETAVSRLNTFQAVLVAGKNESFVLYNYEMRKWSDKEKTALVGYNPGNAFDFLSHDFFTTNAQKASLLGEVVSMTANSNVGRSGQRMYDVHFEPPGSKRLNGTIVRINYPAVTTTARTDSGSRGDQNPCQDVDCGPNGRCDPYTGVCICDPGYTGSRCQVDIDECDTNPCQNGGVCTDRIGSYHCACRPGYTGTRCEHNINDCLDSPCHNGGICQDGVDSFACICHYNYTGQFCEIPIDQCSSNPCKNNGKCIPSGDSYICKCPPGYFGDTCRSRYCFDGSACEEYHECHNIDTDALNCTCSNNPPNDGNCQKKNHGEREPVCRSSISQNDAKGDVTWPETVYREIAVVRCPFPSSKNATRECGGDIWLDPNMTECNDLNPSSKRLLSLLRAIITAENASDIANWVMSITQTDSGNFIAYDIANIANILGKVVEAAGVSLDRNISNDVISSISNIIDAPPEQIQAASNEFSANSKFLRVIDKVLLKLEIHSSEEYLESENIKVAVAKIEKQDSFTGISFSLSSDKVRLSSQSDQNRVGTSIVLPSSVTSSIPNTSFSNRVQFAVYTKTSLFQNAKMITKPSESDMMPNFTLLSKNIISASVGEYKISDLAENVTITLPKTASNFYGNGPYCVFYEFPAESNTGSWSADGCSLKEDSGSSITCECNHLTNFAAIMDVYGTVEYFDESQQKILQILTYIGCGLSIFGLLSTLISYTIFKKIRKEAPAKILISLCTALIAVNIVYLFMQSAYYGTPTTCVVVAAIMHYVLLSSLTWMGVEAINMYIALVKVFNTYYRRYMLKMSIIGWGLPLVIVGTAFAVQFITEIPSYEMNSKTEICWLRRGVFYGTLVGPFAIIFLFNIIIYCLVLGQLLGMSSRKLKHLDSARRMRRPAKRENVRKIRGAIGLMALLGISWGFALATIDEAALTFSYVFVVFNSSQGFWVFLFHCVLKKEVCRAWKKLLCGRRKSGDGSSRWSRFSSSNSKATGTTKSMRSLSSSSIRTSYLVPKPSISIDRSEVSIGLDSNGIDQVTRSISEGYTNTVFDDPGCPPPFPPPPVPPEDRKVRRVPRNTTQGPSNTIATQTDSRFIGFESGSDDDSNEERRDSVDDTFVPRGGIPPHRRVQMSPSNESGVYSDTSISSIAYPSSRHRIATRHHNNTVENNHTNANDNNSVSSNECIHTSVQSSNDPPLNNTTPLRVDSKATDSGISMSSDVKDSPGTSRDVNPKLTNDNRASFYSTHSRDSDGSTPSSESDTTNTQNPAPHLWKAPLVIKRKESESGSPDSQKKLNKEGKIKRGLWKKHHNHSTHTSTETVEKIDMSRHNITRKFSKFQGCDDKKSDVKTKMVPDFNCNSIDDEAL